MQYLRSVRPLLDDTNYERMEKLAGEFRNGTGPRLQKYLMLKRWWATNYVSDWWEEYVYLRGRAPIMVNSNFYGTDTIIMHPTFVQSARAANVVHAAFTFRRQIDNQLLQPVSAQTLSSFFLICSKNAFLIVLYQSIIIDSNNLVSFLCRCIYNHLI